MDAAVIDKQYLVESRMRAPLPAKLHPDTAGVPGNFCPQGYETFHVLFNTTEARDHRNWDRLYQLDQKFLVRSRSGGSDKPWDPLASGADPAFSHFGTIPALYMRNNVFIN